MRCTITRWQLSNALDRGDLTTRAAQGHAARCADCRAFAANLAALHGSLALGADHAPAPRIGARSRFALPVAGLLAAGAAAAVTIGALRHDPAPTVAPAPPVAVAAPVPVSLPVADLTKSATQAALHVDRPLARELDAIVGDGKSGVAAVLATGGLDRAMMGW